MHIYGCLMDGRALQDALGEVGPELRHQQKVLPQACGERIGVHQRGPRCHVVQGGPRNEFNVALHKAV